MVPAKDPWVSCLGGGKNPRSPVFPKVPSSGSCSSISSALGGPRDPLDEPVVPT